jgi:putative heme transporter
MLDSWGFSRAASTLAVLVTGVFNTFIKLALPVLALALIALQGDASRSRATTRFSTRARDLLGRRWPAITTAALVSHLSLYLVLLVTLRHVGVGDAEVGWAQVLFVFAGARLVTAVRFTPGGAGVVEAVLIGGLVAFGGDPAQVTASVLVFRALTWLLPIPLGALAYLGWRWGKHRRAAADAAGQPARVR